MNTLIHGKNFMNLSHRLKNIFTIQRLTILVMRNMILLRLYGLDFNVERLVNIQIST